MKVFRWGSRALDMFPEDNALDKTYNYEGKASKTYAGEYVFEDWGRREFTLGTCIESFQINQSIIQKLNEPLSGKVFFAGELYDLHHQLGVPGAIVSGYPVSYTHLRAHET